MTLGELCMLRVGIWGLGREGLDMVRLLAERGVTPVLIDDRPMEANRRMGGDTDVIEPGEVPWAALDVVVRSPGVSRYRSELAVAEAAGVRVTTAMALWLEDYADARVVAVTGTKGKSTTATLLASLLREDGLDVELLGNIGVPVTAAYGRPRADAFVVEVSSYQAADVAVTPGVCVLTSLAPDHLDWHGGEEAYFRDKLRLVEVGPPGHLAVNAANDEAVRRTSGHPDRSLFGPTGRVRWTDDEVIEVDGVPVADARLLRAPGFHNRWNLCGAVAGALLLNGRAPSAEALAATIDGFDPLPSRCRTLGQRDGITFVDDALASNPFATEASLLSFPGRPLTLIVGGADRGVDHAGLVEAVAARRPAPRVIVLPPEPGRLAEALQACSDAAGSPVPVEVAADLADAVGRARRGTADGGVVLFSPAAPTPVGEGGYASRSRQFADAAGLGGDDGDA
jgi:UDP-N-acetylmuramoyl-L-alanine---L-glutamate ligase